ncbi:hypothetical protein QAD02_021935 [Eretmocerus hayati]|uniref:Uncharacterized protein n=1 Tax=Eretmocerus hayati TaxID=131215 RepID=A0ACC2PTN0_9HYME|nr:hypothetical protein QAD02_021935 [Eretmocerus hayati]
MNTNCHYHNGKPNFHIPRRRIRERSLAQTVSRRLLNDEVRDIHYHLRFLDENLDNLKAFLYGSNVDQNTLDVFIDLNQQRFRYTQSKFNHIHKKKFMTLLPSERRPKVNKKHWIKNISGVGIPDNVIDIVSLGHNYSTESSFGTKDILSTVKDVETCLRLSDLNSVEEDSLRQNVCNIIKFEKGKHTHISVTD